jgi:hypothetical protein
LVAWSTPSTAALPSLRPYVRRAASVTKFEVPLDL